MSARSTGPPGASSWCVPGPSHLTVGTQGSVLVQVPTPLPQPQPTAILHNPAPNLSGKQPCLTSEYMSISTLSTPILLTVGHSPDHNLPTPSRVCTPHVSLDPFYVPANFPALVILSRKIPESCAIYHTPAHSSHPQTMFPRTKRRYGPTKGTKRQDKLEERGRHQKTEGDEDTGRQTMEERSRKIWKPKHGTQSPTAMSWSLRCRPLPGQTTPVMPTRNPGANCGQSPVHGDAEHGSSARHCPSPHMQRF